jgi:hypothetical protein
VKYAGLIYLEDGAGGAFYADGGARFAIARCLFLENRAANSRNYVAPSGLQGGYGGAIALDATSKGRVAATVFCRNHADQSAGAINVANWTGYPRGTLLELYHCTLHGNTAASYTGGIYNYGNASLRGHGNIFYENVNPSGSPTDVDYGPLSTSFFSSNLFTAGSTLTGNKGAGNVFRASGVSIFEDPTNPAGPDNIWGTSDDGYRLRPGAIAPIAQAPPPDFADADGDGNFLEPLPLDAKGDSFGSAPFDLGAYQSP